MIVMWYGMVENFMDTMIVKWLVVIMSFGTLQQVLGDVLKEELFANPLLISAKISPDGNTIAYVGADENGISNVFICPRDGSYTNRTQISFFTTPEIIQFFWSGNSKRVLLLKDENGTGKLNLHGINIYSKNHVVYTEELSNIYAKVIQISSKKNSAVIGLNNRNPHFHDLYLLDLDSGHFELLFENDCYAKFLVSDNLDLILKMRINEEDGSWTIFASNDDVFMELTSSEAFQTEFLSYNEKSQSVYLLDNRFSDTNRLIVKSFQIPGDEKVLGAQSNSDIDDILFIGREPKAYASYYEMKKWHVVDPSIQQDITFLENHIGTNFEVINTNQNGDFWMISNSIPDKGEQFWIYDTKTQNLSTFHISKSNCDSFAKMYSMVVSARDGQKLICYYTLPSNVIKVDMWIKPFLLL